MFNSVCVCVHLWGKAIHASVHHLCQICCSSIHTHLYSFSVRFWHVNIGIYIYIQHMFFHVFISDLFIDLDQLPLTVHGIWESL